MEYKGHEDILYFIGTPYNKERHNKAIDENVHWVPQSWHRSQVEHIRPIGFVRLPIGFQSRGVVMSLDISGSASGSRDLTHVQVGHIQPHRHVWPWSGKPIGLQSLAPLVLSDISDPPILGRFRIYYWTYPMTWHPNGQKLWGGGGLVCCRREKQDMFEKHTCFWRSYTLKKIPACSLHKHHERCIYRSRGRMRAFDNNKSFSLIHATLDDHARFTFQNTKQKRRKIYWRLCLKYFILREKRVQC
jgi:hypothetical protein